MRYKSGGEWRDLYEYQVTLDQDTNSSATVALPPLAVLWLRT